MEEREQPLGERIPPLARFEKSAERRALEERLRSTEQGDFISYEELSRIAGVEDIRDCRYLLQGARWTVLREGFVFDCVTGMGIKRVDPVGALGVTQSHVGRARNASHRAATVLHQVPREQLTEKNQAWHARMDIQIGVTLQFTSKHNARRLEKAAVQTTHKQLKAAIESAVREQFKK